MNTDLFLKLIFIMVGKGIVASQIYYFAEHIVRHDKEIFNSVSEKYSVYTIAKSFFRFMSGNSLIPIKNWDLYEKYKNLQSEVGESKRDE